jgi:pyruvate kinase
VNNLLEIIDVCDGIMVARGDLGVEIPYVELPDIQKYIISQCRIHGKRVITATEMLESMIHNPRPTRAEISDVANAVYDGTSAVMLSGETAAGAYPVQSVTAMAKILEHAEEHIEYIQTIDNFEIRSTSEALSHSAATLAKDLNAKVIVAVTKSGHTARCVSKYRPNVPIVAPTPVEKTYNQLALCWGVYPVKAIMQVNASLLLDHAIACAKMAGYVNKGDRVVITAGENGVTNILNVQVVKNR